MEHFLLNGKTIVTADVLQKGYSGNTLNTTFEKHLFTFIRQWYSKEQSIYVRTSGSTGKPTNIQIYKRQMIASAKNTILKFNLKTGDKVLMCLDSSQIAGMMMVVRAITGQLNLMAVRPSANPFETLTEEQQPDFAAMVPYQLKGILRSNSKHRKMLNNLKVLLLGGGPVDDARENEILKLKVPVYLGFGMTETVSHIALRCLNGPGLSSEYKCLQGIEIKTDIRGCLCIKGNITDNKWVITNDQVTLTDEHSFFWHGRADNVINSGGIKIHPEELEKLIARYFIGKDQKFNFFVTGLPDADTGQKLYLIVEGKSVKQDWIKELKNLLPAYQNPKEVLFIDKFSYTENGKTQRNKTIQNIIK